jgi:murein tripeptide amidase MpaA
MVSYLIEYVIDFLIGNSVEARILRENFVFYVVPMLNIDGVINGNYRFNLAGVDLNR